MWRPPFTPWKEESFLLNGINQIIRDEWPHLELYFTGKGWIRKQRYD